MYIIGICDDGEHICTAIEEMLLHYAGRNEIHIDSKVWYTGEGLKEYLEQGNHLDVLFLDIELFRMTGIEVGNYIRNQLDNTGMQIIYISSKASYAQQLFKTQPLDFLVKPIEQKMVDDVMDAALKIVKRKNIRFEFQQGKNHYYVPMGEIVCFRSEGRKVHIVTLKESYQFYGKLKDVIKQLSENFIVIHQSYVVNRDFIYRYTYEMVELMNGEVMTISPTNRKKVREKILREE